ncbi:hypothetical protein NGRA_0385 [Nosema granulosis]|uniref:Uncharacterized protein n=1 Tax=Nosema granulosis TaxID=83296 RepID=A0A9P6L0L1_9MICR|nr:hypothetical protein NGRA_0385 [Nosema granulosis]
MKNILLYILFTYGNPCLYNPFVNKKVVERVSDCIKSLYRPENLIIIDKNAIFNENPVLFVTFNPYYIKKISIGTKKKLIYYEISYNDRKTNLKDLDFNEDLGKFALWASKIIVEKAKEIFNDKEYQIYFTILRKEFLTSKYSDKVFKRFTSKIKETIQNEDSRCLDIKFHPEYLETYVGTSLNLRNVCLKTECISFDQDNYTFMLFLQKNFYKKIDDELIKVFEIVKNEQIEKLANEYKEKSLQDCSPEEQNDLFILSIFYTIKEGFVGDNPTEVQQQILCDILKYLIIKKGLHLFINDFFKEESASLTYLAALRKSTTDFETEKEGVLIETGLGNLKDTDTPKKLVTYLNAITKDVDGLASYKFIVDIFVFFSLEIKTLSKIIFSNNRSSNIGFGVEQLIKSEAQEYWKQWLKDFFEYIQASDKSPVKETKRPEIRDFKTLNQLCIDFAIKNNPPDQIINKNLYQKALEYYSEPNPTDIYLNPEHFATSPN